MGKRVVPLAIGIVGGYRGPWELSRRIPAHRRGRTEARRGGNDNGIIKQKYLGDKVIRIHYLHIIALKK